MLTTNPKHAFIDESGSFGYDFDKKGTSEYFIITAVIIDRSNLEAIRAELTDIQRTFFGGGEIKSSKIGSDYVKRIEILRKLAHLDFDVLAYVVNKKEINLHKAPGMKYKESFLKFTHRHLHQELTTLYESLDVVADEHGTKEFMDGFIDYFHEKELYLFSKYDFQFKNSNDDIFLQLADLICGTISYKYEDKPHKEKYRAFLQILRYRTIRFEEWPIEYKKYMADLSFLKFGLYDSMIANHCLKIATDFVNRDESKLSNIELDQVNVIKFLLYKLRYENPKSYYTAKEIRSYLSRIGDRNYSNHQFKSLIIAKLRDRGIIISSSKGGYKIPISELELYSYTNQTMQIIYPMLERLRKCRKEIKALTADQLDILDKREYREIRDYFDHVKKDK